MNQYRGPSTPAPAPAAPPPARAQTFRAALRAARWPLTLVGGALLGMALMVLYLQVRPPAGRLTDEDVRRIANQQIASITPAPPVAPILYAQLRPAVVTLSVAGRNPDNTSFAGRGSGVVIDTDSGIIMTSYHVIAGADRVNVQFYDGSVASARVNQKQPERDLATIKVEKLPDGIEAATLGGGVSPGDPIMAIGSPFGFDASVSQGVVSAINRRFTVASTGQTLDGMIQFDAAVNPGNSGGPLVDMQGHVVGIVTGIANPTNLSVFIGLGFAVPLTGGSGLEAPIH